MQIVGRPLNQLAASMHSGSEPINRLCSFVCLSDTKAECRVQRVSPYISTDTPY